MSWNVLVAGTKRAILAHIESKQPDTWDECARRIMTEAVLNLQDGSTYVLKSQGHLDTYGGQATLEVVRAQILSEPESLSTAPPVWRPPADTIGQTVTPESGGGGSEK